MFFSSVFLPFPANKCKHLWDRRYIQVKDFEEFFVSTTGKENWNNTIMLVLASDVENFSLRGGTEKSLYPHYLPHPPPSPVHPASPSHPSPLLAILKGMHKFQYWWIHWACQIRPRATKFHTPHSLCEHHYRRFVEPVRRIFRSENWTLFVDYLNTICSQIPRHSHLPLHG